MPRREDARASRFREEYERLNRDVYGGALPSFPGVVLTRRTDIYSAANTTGRGSWRRLDPFLLSERVTDDALLLECIRHETAHAAALLFDEDEGHGPAWRAHAARCGARPRATG